METKSFHGSCFQRSSVEKAREGYHVDVADVRLPYGRLCILCCARSESCGNETLKEAVEFLRRLQKQKIPLDASSGKIPVANLQNLPRYIHPPR